MGEECVVWYWGEAEETSIFRSLAGGSETSYWASPPARANLYSTEYND